MLHGAPFRWWIAGGWALDLFLGQQTREHSDVDIAVFRDDQDLVRNHLPRWTFEYVDTGSHERIPWRDDFRINVPIHEIWAQSAGSHSQLEFLLNERDATDWIFRRDKRARLPLSHLDALQSSGVPFLPPEIVLLFKSNRLNPKNMADLAAVNPTFGSDSRAWLAAAIALTNSSHPWIASLGEWRN